MTTIRTFSFTSRPEAVTAARRALDGFDELLELGLFYDASLCVSELVTLAVLWSDGTDSLLRLDVSIRSGTLRVTVTGMGDVDPAPPSVEDDTGLGLYIVDQLSNRWGVERGPDAEVWFEMRALPRGTARKHEAPSTADPKVGGRVRRRPAGVRDEPRGGQPQTAWPYVTR